MNAIPLIVTVILAVLCAAEVHADSIEKCEIERGLDMLSRANHDESELARILAACDRARAIDPRATDFRLPLLHGLAERRARRTEEAAKWLEQAYREAPQHTPTLIELAVTYEWLNRFDDADRLYAVVLSRDQTSIPARLGRARAAQGQSRYSTARNWYRQVAAEGGAQLEARTGLARLALAEKDFDAARNGFLAILAQTPEHTPEHADAAAGLAQLDDAYRHVAEITFGNRSLAVGSSKAIGASFSTALNGTDTIDFALGHNTRELATQRALDPTPLAQYTARIGYRSFMPSRLSWGIEYEYLDRRNSRGENRLNLNLNGPLAAGGRWFVGGRQGFPSPWRNRLLYLGATIPVARNWEVTGTAYYADEQAAGIVRAFAAQVGYRAEGRWYYAFGVSRIPTFDSWSAFGRIQFPIARMQELVASFEHRRLGRETEVSVGWRIYWK